MRRTEGPIDGLGAIRRAAVGPGGRLAGAYGVPIITSRVTLVVPALHDAWVVPVEPLLTGQQRVRGAVKDIDEVERHCARDGTVAIAVAGGVVTQGVGDVAAQITVVVS